jgi:hypothetical protein
MSGWPVEASLRRMLSSSRLRLAAFASGLVLTAGAAAAVGAAVEPEPPFQDCLRVAMDRAAPEADAMAGDEEMVEAVSGSDGRRSALAGLELQPLPSSFTPGSSATWRFRIVDCDGEVVRDFEPEQGKLLHLIVVRSDFTAYQHLHPRLTGDGTFEVTVATPRPGRYRAIADFVIDGRKVVLGTTITAGDGGADRPLPSPSLHATTSGYDVELQRPALLEAGEDAQLTFRITRDGRPVTGLEPYLGAYGHLVALHAPDLSYSHVHPNGEDRTRGAITFTTELHERGAFRLFLQFRAAGRVHTVAFTQTVTS